MEMVASLSLSLLWISKARRVEHPSFLELPRDITGYRHPRVEAGDGMFHLIEGSGTELMDSHGVKMLKGDAQIKMLR